MSFYMVTIVTLYMNTWPWSLGAHSKYITLTPMGKCRTNVLRYAFFVYQGLIQEVCDLDDVDDMMWFKRHITKFASTTIKFRKFNDIIVYLLLTADMCLPWKISYSGNYGRYRPLPLVLCTKLQGACTWVVLCWTFLGLDSRCIWLPQAGTAIITHHNKWIASRSNTLNAYRRKA